MSNNDKKIPYLFNIKYKNINKNTRNILNLISDNIKTPF